MVVDIDKYPLRTLTDVSKIFTAAGFLRVFREGLERDVMHTFILCPDIYVPEDMTADLVEANGFERGYAVMPESGINIVYLTSILNSAVSWAVMTDGKLEEQAKILLKNLKKVLVRALPTREQQSIAVLQYLIMEMKRQQKEGSNNPYIDYWTSKYHEAMNAIALELVMPQVYGEYEIDVLGSWLRPDVENGIHVLSPKVKAIVSEYDTKTVNEYGYEAHREWIDIQFLVNGVEKICCLPLEYLKETKAYSNDIDTAFYKESDIKPQEMVMGNGFFSIFFPQDGHMPCLEYEKPYSIKKVVVKVLDSPGF